MPKILYEDAHLLLIEKPTGVPSQDADGDCVPRRLYERNYSIKVVHRLDKPTGGVMVYARTDRAAAKLSALVGQHELFQKEYLAVVQGCPNEMSGTFTDLLYHDNMRNKSYVVNRERKGVRQASLEYTVIETTTIDKTAYSLVRVRLHTGRTHQIRVQFASRKMPLYGDSRYGGCKGGALGLWSHKLSFPHPLTGQSLTGESVPNKELAPWCFFKFL